MNYLGAVKQISFSRVDQIPCGENLSGMVAVAWLASGGVGRAQRAVDAAGWRLPAIGVVLGTYNSGDVVDVYRGGPVRANISGIVASGWHGLPLYVGSGGLIVNQSGFMGGASSGPGPVTISGCLVNRIGVAISGGIDVMPDNQITSGLYSGGLRQW